MFGFIIIVCLLFFLLIPLVLYFFSSPGSLPWSSHTTLNNPSNHYESALKLKNQLSGTPVATSTLCRGLPSNLTQFLHNVRLLKFDEKIDYLALKELFVSAFRKYGYAEVRI